MEQIVIGIGMLVVGFIIGWKGRESFAAWRVKLIMKEYQDSHSVDAEKFIPITIEEHSGVYFVYDVDGQFMAQANDRETLETTLMDKYPGKMFAATQENLKEMGFK